MSSAAHPLPGDDSARARIRTSLHESLLVEASAGTGKTSELVRRIVAVLEEGLTTVDRVVAVTFTHKEAGEMKLRLRQGLDLRRAMTEDRRKAHHLEEALERLEEASIGTIHSFCAQILRERPVEALVDPAFVELSEQESEALYERAFRGWIERRLSEPSPGLQRALSRLAWRDVAWDTMPPLEQLQYAGRQLIDWRDFPEKWERIAFDREAEIDRLVARAQETSARVSSAFAPVHEFAQWVSRAEGEGRQRDYDTIESLLLRLLRDLRNIRKKGVEDLVTALESFRADADADLATQLRGEMWELVERYEQVKRRSGQLDFLDLLMLARDLVRGKEDVRRYLQDRFSHIFVDEFQDTDPLQAELLLLLAADDPKQTNWLEARPVAGKWFAVGDPKQSIYKFRRADVVLYQAVKKRLVDKGVGFVQLTRSFRAVRPIQQCINAAFEPEMAGDPEAGQAQYTPLEEHAAPPEGQPCVIALPAPKPYGRYRVTKSAVNECLPDTIVAFVEWLVKESGWTVRDLQKPAERIPVSGKHVAILFRRFTNLGNDLTRDYTRSLEARNIPHLLVGSKSFHSREEIGNLRAALAAVEWPEDELSVFATLRGSLFSIDDALLLRFRHEVGRLHPFRLFSESEAAEFAPVREALSLLAELHRSRNRIPAADTVNRLLEATRAHAAFALRPAGHQVLANVYRVADLARSFEMEGGISFRGFVGMLEAQAERVESAEAPVLEEGAEGVRLMTVHAAKGLEFPVVILADITANLAAKDPERYVNAERRLCAMRLLRCTPWELRQHEQEERAREQAEGVRVAYVAATRARDLLVVPAVGDDELQGWVGPLNKALYPAAGRHRQATRAPACPIFGERTVLERPIEYARDQESSVRPGMHKPRAGEHTVVWWDPGILKLAFESNFGLRQEEILAEGSEESGNRYREWKAARAEALASGSRPQFDVFTATEAREGPREFVCEVAVERVARPAQRPSGPRFGTLVHAVLRDVDLEAQGAAVRDIARLHGRLMGAGEEDVDAAADAVAAALRHHVLARARAAERRHRELPVILPVERRLLEGVIDLAFREDGGWTVVDFKTDEDLSARRVHYEAQVRWYALALSRLTGEPTRAVLLSL